MKSFEVFGDSLSAVILGKSPEVAGWAIMLNFELHNLPFARGEGVLLPPAAAELLSYVACSSGIPVEMVEPLICSWMSQCIQATDRLRFGITDTWHESCALEENSDFPGNMQQVETSVRDGVTLFNLDVDHWKAWQTEHQVEFEMFESEA